MAEQPPDDVPRGTLRPTPPATLALWAAVGLVGGFLLHSLSDALDRIPPVVSWAHPTALFVVAALLLVTAWLTWRAVHVQRIRLQPHQAVNRLVLARASALVGALVAGGYLGYGVSWFGVDTALGHQRLLRSLVAALGGVLIVVAALLLERACRVRSEPEEP